MANCYFSAVYFHPSGNLSLFLICPSASKEIGALWIRKEAKIEIDRVVQVGTCDVNLAPGVRIFREHGYGEVLPRVLNRYSSTMWFQYQQYGLVRAPGACSYALIKVIKLRGLE